MSIKDLLEKVKPFYYLVLVLIISAIFFGLGRLSAIESQKKPIRIEQLQESQSASALIGLNNSEFVTSGASNSGEVIGSKNGGKYYFPWCGTVKMIKPENQIRFTSADEARKAGYLPAENCKGLK